MVNLVFYTVMYTLTKQTTNAYFNSGLDSFYLDQFLKHYAYINPYPEAIIKAPFGIPLRDEQLLPRHISEKTEYYNDWMRPQNFSLSQFGCKIKIDSNRYVAVAAHLEKNNFDKNLDVYTHIFSNIIPHISNSFQLLKKFQKYKWKTNGLSGLWDVKSEAVIFINNEGRVVFANQFAEHLIHEKLFSIRDHGIIFNNSSVNRKFQKSLMAICQNPIMKTSTHEVILTQDENQNDYGIRLVPYLGDISDLNLVATNLAMLVITPLSGIHSINPSDVHRFGQLYGLTEAEEQVVAAIAANIELSEFSKTKNIKIDTARKQLKSALFKTGLRSQKQLVRLIDRFCFLNLK